MVSEFVSPLRLVPLQCENSVLRATCLRTIRPLTNDPPMLRNMSGPCSNAPRAVFECIGCPRNVPTRACEKPTMTTHCYSTFLFWARLGVVVQSRSAVMRQTCEKDSEKKRRRGRFQCPACLWNPFFIEFFVSSLLWIFAPAPTPCRLVSPDVLVSMPNLLVHPVFPTCKSNQYRISSLGSKFYFLSFFSFFVVWLLFLPFLFCMFYYFASSLFPLYSINISCLHYFIVFVLVLLPLPSSSLPSSSSSSSSCYYLSSSLSSSYY